MPRQKKTVTEGVSVEEVKKQDVAESAKKPAAKKAAAPKKVEISKEQFVEEVEKKSYALFEERQKSGKTGSSLEDWLTAEAEVKAKYGL